jgi:Peptidase family M28
MGDEEPALTHRLRTHVDHLAGEIGERNIFRPAALQAAASYIEREWERQGYAVAQIAYDVSGVRSLNLEITRSGGARQREILLLGAHYDTVTGSPGANDNASGVSALLEISRLFASIEPALTVRFVAFVNEEPPFFMTRRQGSMVLFPLRAQFARRMGRPLNSRNPDVRAHLSKPFRRAVWWRGFKSGRRSGVGLSVRESREI